MDALNILAIVLIIFGLRSLLKEVYNYMSRRARLKITCDHLDAEVFIDGVFKGQCPLEEVLAPGRHVVTIKQEMEDGSYFEYEGDAHLPKGGRKDIDVVLIRKYTEKYYWQIADSANTVEYFEMYIDKFKEGIHTTDAKRRLENLFFDRCADLPSCNEYLRRYPRGKRMQEINDRVEDMLYAECESIGGGLKYVAAYPAGKFINDPKIKRVKKLLASTDYKIVRRMEGHEGPVSCLAVSPTRIYSGSGDKTIRIWDVTTGNPAGILRAHTDGVTALLLAGKRLVSASDDGVMIVWDIEDSVIKTTIRGHTSWVTCMTLAGGRLISGSEDKTIRVWDLETGQHIKTLGGHTGSIWCLAAAGETLISGSEDKTIRVWDLKTGKEVKLIEGHKDNVWSLVMIGDSAVSASWDDTIRVWDLKTTKQLGLIKGNAGRFYSLRLDDGKIFAGSWDSKIRVWDFKSGEILRTLEGHKDSVFAIEKIENAPGQPPRDRFVSASFDKSIIAWEVEHLKEGPAAIM